MGSDLNQLISPNDRDELIKEADASDRPDSLGESLWIAFGDPFPVPIVSESRFGPDRGSMLILENQHLVDELCLPRESVCEIASLPLVNSSALGSPPCPRGLIWRNRVKVVLSGTVPEGSLSVFCFLVETTFYLLFGSNVCFFCLFTDSSGGQ